MRVEIWSDVVCPWCYIGKRRFERALDGFDRAAEVEVEWRSFELNPAQPKGVRQPIDEQLAEKLGGSVEQARALNARVTALAAEEGLDYHFERYQVVNTFDAHRMAHLAVAGARRRRSTSACSAPSWSRARPSTIPTRWSAWRSRSASPRPRRAEWRTRTRSPAR